MAFLDYSTTPSANTSIAGQNIAPGGPPAAVGPGIRQIMADGKALAVKAPRAPEDYSGNIQATINAENDAPANGEILFTKASYLLADTVTADSKKASLLRGSLLDARNLTAIQPVLRIDGSVATNPLGNAFGTKIELDGIALARGGAIVGAGAMPFIGDGLLLDGSHEAGSAQIVGNRLAIAGHNRGVVFANRAYNNTFYHTETWSCVTAIHWVAGGIDNGERNTGFGCVEHDSDVAFQLDEPSGAYQKFGGSIDFCKSLQRTNGGKYFGYGVHEESATLGLYDGYASKVEGDGGLVNQWGGFLLNQAANMPISSLWYVGDGSRRLESGRFIHNLKLTRNGPNNPTAFYNGPGVGLLRDTHSFAAVSFPDRLHQGRTSLQDMNGTDAAFRDMIYVDERCAARTDRYTSTDTKVVKSTNTPQFAPRGIAIQKTGAAGAVQSSVGLMWVPIQYGQLAFGGFFYARDGGTDQPFSANWFWASLDRIGNDGLPIFFAQNVIAGAAANLVATSAYQMCAFAGGFADRIAPAGTTHFVCRIDLDAAAPFTLNIGQRWADAA